MVPGGFGCIMGLMSGQVGPELVTGTRALVVPATRERHYTQIGECQSDSHLLSWEILPRRWQGEGQTALRKENKNPCFPFFWKGAKCIFYSPNSNIWPFYWIHMIMEMTFPGPALTKYVCYFLFPPQPEDGGGERKHQCWTLKLCLTWKAKEEPICFFLFFY